MLIVIKGQLEKKIFEQANDLKLFMVSHSNFEYVSYVKCSHKFSKELTRYVNLESIKPIFKTIAENELGLPTCWIIIIHVKIFARW